MPEKTINSNPQKSLLNHRLLELSESLASSLQDSIIKYCQCKVPGDENHQLIFNISKDIINLLSQDIMNGGEGRNIGKRIYQLDLLHPEKLTSVHKNFLSDISLNFEGDDLLILYPRVCILLVDIISGFVESTQKFLLFEQEQIRSQIEKAKNEAEFARQQIESRHNVIVENIPEIIIIIDIDGNVVYYHPGKRERNQSSIKMEGINIKNLLSKDFYKEFKKASQQALSTGERQVITTSFPYYNKMRIFEGRIAPYTEDKTITIVRDITEIIDYQNALKTSQANLQEMTRQIIDIQESERHQIALDLHDQVLSQLGALFLYIDESSIPPKFIDNYHKLVDQIRSTIYNLRPPMLNYGLYPALDDLRTYLINQYQSNIPIEFIVAPSNVRVDPNIELHLFRIIQEAANNACKHSQATRIIISGEIRKKNIWLSVEDDGIGIQCCEKSDLTKALLHNHFGIAGMFERAALIGADISITSNPNKGTKLTIKK